MSHIAIDARIINSTTGRYVERLLNYLQTIDQENQYTVLVRAKDEQYWQPQSPNFTVKIADFADYSFAEQFAFKSLLDNLKPDLVHFCMPQQPILYTGKHVTTVHDLTLLNAYNSDKNWFIYRSKQLVGRFVFWKIARSSSHIITPSYYTKKAYADFARISLDKITVTHEAADKIIADPQPYDAPFKKFLLYVGQHSDYKNVTRLGDAHQQLLSRYPDLGLILVGKKNASALNNERYFASKGYKNIHFTGFVEDAQLAWLYSHCQAYVFPSLMEGFGLPGLEAMNYFVPVIGSNATCLPEIYQDAAHYFDPKSVDSIAQAIDEVLRDDSLRMELITKSRDLLPHYSWLTMAKQTHSVYVQALKD